MLEDNNDFSAADPLESLLLQNSVELPPVDYGVSMMKMCTTLFLLILLSCLTIWLFRRIMKQRLEKGSEDQIIQILEKKMISPKTMLYVVEMGGQRILLAESQLEVRPISLTKAPERVDLL